MTDDSIECHGWSAMNGTVMDEMVVRSLEVTSRIIIILLEEEVNNRHVQTSYLK